jgi:hypothetical protein
VGHILLIFREDRSKNGVTTQGQPARKKECLSGTRSAGLLNSLTWSLNMTDSERQGGGRELLRDNEQERNH